MQHKERVGKRREVMTGLLGLLGGRIPAERREIDLVDHVELGLGLVPRGFDASGQEAARLAREGGSHELAVHHHERLRDGPLKARGFVSLVVAEGEQELLEPVFASLIAAVATAGLMGVSRRQQRVEKLLRRHGPKLHRVEQTLLFLRPFHAHAAGVVGAGGRDQADQVLDIVAVRLKLLGQPVEQLGMGGRIVRTQVINRIDEPPAHEVGPHPVGRGERAADAEGPPTRVELEDREEWQAEILAAETRTR